MFFDLVCLDFLALACRLPFLMTRTFSIGLGLVLFLASMLTGCTASRHNTPYVFVYLKSGPNSGQGYKETRQKMFAGHMANIQRLAEERRLLIAGPYDSPSDKTLRGILVLDVATAKEAAALAATDPGVIAGEFVAETHEMKCSAALRRTCELEQQLQAELKVKPAEDSGAGANKMPPGLRRYTLVTTEEFDKTMEALRAAKQDGLVIWSGRFTGSPRGVLVLDCVTPGDMKAVLIATRSSVDGWWSTASLERLKK